MSRDRDCRFGMLRQQGLTPEMVRLHVGLEDVEDIVAQLEACLARL